MIIDILFLPMIFFIGIVTSWEDFSFGKIRNKWIVLGLVYGVIVLAGLFLWDLMADPVTHYYYVNIKHLNMGDPMPVFTVNFDYFGKVAVNSISSLAVGFLFWRYGLLAAGDAKLFFVFSLLLPLKYYWKSYLPYFPSFALLINIFLPVFFYILLRSSLYLLKSSKKFIAKGMPIIKINKTKIKKGLSEIFVMLIGFMAIFLFMDELGNLMDAQPFLFMPDKSLIFIVMIVLYRPIFSLIKKNKRIFLVICLFIFLYLMYSFFYAPFETFYKLAKILKILLLLMVLLQLFKKIFNYYIKNTNIKKISINELKPGMSPFVDKQQGKNRILGQLDIGNIFGGGVTAAQADSIRKWAQNNNIDNIKIYERFPFAAWMFLGLLITLFLKGAITIYLF